MNNALSPSRADARSLISSISRDTLSTNETHEMENFDDWYIIIRNIDSSFYNWSIEVEFPCLRITQRLKNK